MKGDNLDITPSNKYIEDNGKFSLYHRAFIITVIHVYDEECIALDKWFKQSLLELKYGSITGRFNSFMSSIVSLPQNLYLYIYC